MAKKTVEKKLKEIHVVEFEGNEIKGTLQFVQNAVFQLAIPMRYSVSKDDFVSVTDMHENHLINALKEDISLCGTYFDMITVLHSPIAVELNARHANANEATA